ncbi:TPA: hypothetical protein NJ913_004405 [Vibrio parahaemolyticus]|nr:hypothetical protein [Vibrio parahaemolyticus]
MKCFLVWIKWSVYRFKVANEMHKELSGKWTWFECWSYADCFHYQWQKSIEQGDEPDPIEDVEDELFYWRY